MMRCSPLRGMASARWRRSIARLLMVLPCSASPAVRDDLRYTRRRPPWLLASAREEMQSLVLCETARSARSRRSSYFSRPLTAHRGRALLYRYKLTLYSRWPYSLYIERDRQTADRFPRRQARTAHRHCVYRYTVEGSPSTYTDAYCVKPYMSIYDWFCRGHEGTAEAGGGGGGGCSTSSTRAGGGARTVAAARGRRRRRGGTAPLLLMMTMMLLLLPLPPASCPHARCYLFTFTLVES